MVATFPSLIVIYFILSFFVRSPEQFLENIGLPQCGLLTPNCSTSFVEIIIMIWLFPLFTFLLNWLVVRFIFLFKRSDR